VYPTPIDIEFIDMRPNKGAIGGYFKQKAKFVFKFLEEMTECDKEEAMGKIGSGESLHIDIEGEQTEITP